MTSRHLPLALLLALALASPARAGIVNFFWDDCAADGGKSGVRYDCSATTASTVMQEAIGSFILSDSMPDFIAVEVVVDLQTASTVVPPWWEFSPSPGACRGTALSFKFDFSVLANASCEDPFGEPATGGLANYTVTGNRARIIGVGAIDVAFPRALNPGKEYYGFRLALRLNRATGTGSCAGCSTTVDLVLNSIRAVRVGAVSGEDCYPITNQSIRWQCSSCPTPALSRTWGQVKSLFR